MNKEFYEKYGKEFHCATCQELTTCVNRSEPLFSNCCEQFLRDKISDLEAKLAEKNEQLKIALEDFNETQNENDKLQHQLAEKKKEIEDLEASLVAKDFCFHLVNGPDKISFAIEQINKVKELYKKHLDYERIYDEFRVMMLEEDIESLITELKGGINV